MGICGGSKGHSIDSWPAMGNHKMTAEKEIVFRGMTFKSLEDAQAAGEAAFREGWRAPDGGRCDPNGNTINLISMTRKLDVACTVYAALRGSYAIIIAVVSRAGYVDAQRTAEAYNAAKKGSTSNHQHGEVAAQVDVEPGRILGYRLIQKAYPNRWLGDYVSNDKATEVVLESMPGYDQFRIMRESASGEACPRFDNSVMHNPLHQ